MTADTAQALLTHAASILRAEGAAAVSMRRIARLAGLSAMAPYRHFPDRAALLDRLADTEFDRLGAHWRRLAGSGSGQSQLDRLLDAHLDFALREPLLYAFLFTEPRTGARRYPDDFQHDASPTLSVLSQWLRDGVQSGEFRVHDVAELSLVVAAQLHGLIQLHHGGRIAVTDDELRALCARSIEVILDGIRR